LRHRRDGNGHEQTCAQQRAPCAFHLISPSLLKRSG
jgi:hypothetical protein